MSEAPRNENGADGTEALPRDLRFLKALVTVLTVVMIGGVITIVALLVIRLNAPAPQVVVDPGMFAMPAGVATLGISVVRGHTVITGDDGVIRVYDSESRALLQEIDLPR
ncbi:DUF6476 family protein [Roseibacterium sp. SDUM158017]|uniref:DUF6476 family protein n=1 Tax=Roseicyclus salinarum TaxID=3036773 RepID=UPI002414D09B|nr:DUF6476 family protein [Roseibacterium sp. SDUM158017]MDG4647450.1 DUF6476 family protein [Roseibacterium sp. SDUM158017]